MLGLLTVEVSPAAERRLEGTGFTRCLAWAPWLRLLGSRAQASRAARGILLDQGLNLETEDYCFV